MSEAFKVLAAVSGVFAILPGLSAAPASEPAPDRGVGTARPDTAEFLLSGRVVDAGGRPVPSVELVFAPRGDASAGSRRRASTDEQAGVTTSTDSAGRFSLRAASATGGRVRLVSDASAPWEFEVDPAPGSDLHVNVVLPPSGDGAAWPVTVDVEARPAALRGSGFYRRRAERDGLFVGPEELREAVRDGGLAGVLSTARGRVRTSGCPEPVMYVDGRRLSDRLTGPNRMELLALEAYRRSDPPPSSFDRPPGCGVVVLWTGGATSMQSEGGDRR